MAQQKQDDAQQVAEAAANAFAAVDGAVGLGVDIVEIERMRAILKRTPSFAARVFSDEERAYCQGTNAPAVHFATRFAAKEAVVKALGTGFSAGIGVRDIEVMRTSKGRPYVVLHGRAKEVARQQGVRELPLSLSFTHTDAVACAMAITERSVQAAEERVDQKAELTRRFKEARGMLDDIEATKAQADAEQKAMRESVNLSAGGYVSNDTAAVLAGAAEAAETAGAEEAARRGSAQVPAEGEASC